jgi:O-antigen/teichoic acid export membrane protein
MIFRLKKYWVYAQNTSWILTERLITMGISVIVVVYVARYLGPEEFGILNFALSCVAILSAFANLGLDDVVVRNLVLSPDETDSILGTAFTLKFIGFCCFEGILILFVALAPIERTSAVFILIVSLSLLFQVYSVIDFYFQSKVAVRYSSLSKIVATLTGAAVRIALVIFQAPLAFFAAAFVLDSAVLAIFLAHAFKANYGKPIRVRFDSRLAVKMLNNSFPLMLSGLAIMVYMRIDQVMIKQLVSAEAVGIYSAAVRLSEAFNFIPIAICTSLFPAMLQSKNESETRFIGNLQRLYDMMVVLSVGISIPLAFLSDHIILFLYGAPYAQAAEVLRISVCGNIFVFLGVASGKWLMTENFTKHALLRTLYGAVVNILLNSFLIPSHGIYGAALATVVSQFVAAYAYDALNRDMRFCFWMKTKSLFPIRLLRGFMR